MRLGIFLITILFLVSCTERNDLIQSTKENVEQTKSSATIDAKMQESEDGKLQAEKIIQALENYRRDNGSFPDNLNELVPGYLDQITVFNNRPFYYEIYKGNYELTFILKSVNEGYCTYINEGDNWDCGIGLIE